MSFILYHKGVIIGCYGTIDLVRINLLILCFRLMEEEEINKLTYDHIVENLEYPEFDELSFQNPNIRINLLDLDIRIQMVDYEGSSRCVLVKILKHIEDRFDNLKDIMLKDVRITATIPGSDPYNHQLGTMYFDCWKLVDKENHNELTKTMYNYISEKIIDLLEKFDSRIKFGEVFYQNASSISYQLWSANAVNWNLEEGEKIPGSYQAKEMKMQAPGVYGIVVNPRYGYNL